MTSIISKNIRFLRKKRGWGQEQLGKKVNRSESTIQMWESDLRSPTMDTVRELSELFNVDINALVYKDLSESNHLYEENTTSFKSAKEAIKYILELPLVANYGGYDLDKMTDDEIIEFANDVANMIKMLGKSKK